MLQCRGLVCHHWSEYANENEPKRPYRMEYVRHLHGQLRGRHHVLSSRSADLWHQTEYDRLHLSTDQPSVKGRSSRSSVLLRKRRMGASGSHWNKARRQSKRIGFAFESHVQHPPTEAADVPRVEHHVPRGVDGFPDSHGVQAARGIRGEDRVLSDGPAGVRRLPVHDLGKHSKYIGLHMLSVYVFQTRFDENQRETNQTITDTHFLFFNVYCWIKVGVSLNDILHVDLIRIKKNKIILRPLDQ